MSAPTLAQAQDMSCGTPGSFLNVVAGQGESPLWYGVTQGGHRLLMTENAKTGSWTLLIFSFDGGKVCLVSMGAGAQVAKDVQDNRKPLPAAPSAGEGG